MSEGHVELGVPRGRVVLAEPTSAWRSLFEREAVRIAAALGPIEAWIEHCGSTSVPGIAAKPIIDILVTVPDITAEEDYLDPLVAEGYLLRVREPDHRMVRTAQRDVHIHMLEVDDRAAGDRLLCGTACASTRPTVSSTRRPRGNR